MIPQLVVGCRGDGGLGAIREESLGIPPKSPQEPSLPKYSRNSRVGGGYMIRI